MDLELDLCPLDLQLVFLLPGKGQRHLKLDNKSIEQQGVSICDRRVPFVVF